MGTWGPGAFENDVALDFAADIVTVHNLSDALTVPASDQLIDVDVACRIAVVAECVAAMRGHPASAIPEELAERLAEFGSPSRSLVRQCRDQLSAIMTRSELTELWAESGPGPFDLAMRELSERLNRPPKRKRGVDRSSGSSSDQTTADGAYPFRPRSAASLVPGHFWAVPISGGRFGCGRVLQVLGSQLPMKNAFFGGLHDWIGDAPPTQEAFAGTRLAHVGVMHPKAITETGGNVLGERPLELDGIELPLLHSQLCAPGVLLLRGADALREARPDELGTLPLLSHWSYGYIEMLAEQLAAAR